MCIVGSVCNIGDHYRWRSSSLTRNSPNNHIFVKCVTLRSHNVSILSKKMFFYQSHWLCTLVIVVNTQSFDFPCTATFINLLWPASSNDCEFPCPNWRKFIFRSHMLPLSTLILAFNNRCCDSDEFYKNNDDANCVASSCAVITWWSRKGIPRSFTTSSGRRQK